MRCWFRRLFVAISVIVLVLGYGTMLLASLTTAKSQSLFFETPRSEIPKTIIINGPQGNPIATGTVLANRVVMRDMKGELLGTVVHNADNTKTLYDPNGKIIEKFPIPELGTLKIQ